MKKLPRNCIEENCIETPSSCITWNGGDVDSLGIKNGDPLNNLMIEIIERIEDIAGEDISAYDLSELLAICNQNAPTNINLISILKVVTENQICLKDFIDTLNDKLTELFKDEQIDINLHCYASFDNFGNNLSITRKELDQLIINELCDHKQRIASLEGQFIELRAQVENIDPTATVEELLISTCIDSGVKPTSQQVQIVATELCDLQEGTGTPVDIAQALSKIPADDNINYGLISGWNLTPDNLAQSYGNLLLKIANLEDRIEYMEANCCALSCEDIKLGFSATFNEDMDGIILKFSFGAGTSIPTGFTDKGSTGTITDKNGNVESFSLSISNNAEIEIPISGLDISENLTVNINAKIGNASLTCEKCLEKTVKSSTCAYCEITASGEEGSSAVIIYRDGTGTNAYSIPVVDENTTTSTTTTTTLEI